MATSSSKWRAMQRRHKWSYDAVRLPSSRLRMLLDVQETHGKNAPSLTKFLSAVMDMVQLTSTHSQVSEMKKVIASFLDILRNLPICSISPKVNNDGYGGERVFSKENVNSVLEEGPFSKKNDNKVFKENSLAKKNGNGVIEEGSFSQKNGTSVLGDHSFSEKIENSTLENGSLSNKNVNSALEESSFSEKNVNGVLEAGSFSKNNGNSVPQVEILAGIAFNLLIEILFLENAVPLHRSILACLASLSRDWEDYIFEAFGLCIREYGLAGPKSRRFVLASIGSSIMNMPKPGILKDLIKNFSKTIAIALCHGVKSLLKESREGGRPSPVAIEECQGAMSCLYYILQYYSDRLVMPYTREKKVEMGIISEEMQDPLDVDGVEVSAYNAALDVILDVLQTGYLSRDCSVAAGVGLCAAAQLETNDSKLALILANSLFTTSSENFAVLSAEGLAYGRDCLAKVDISINQTRGTTLAHEVSKFTEFGRLCFFRGILTAIPRSSLNFNLICLVDDQTMKPEEVNVFMPWNILYNGILPSLCDLCESSGDSHFKFHSVTALQICLQQIKTSINQKITSFSMEELISTACNLGYSVAPYSPIPTAIVDRILQIVWNYWEDPLNQTVKQIQVVFDLLVDIQCTCLDGKIMDIPHEKPEINVSQNEKSKEFLNAILKELMMAGGHRKGRYVPLASLTSRLGAQLILNTCPSLLFESINAMVDDDICCSACTFLKAFFERLREDCWSSEGVMEGNVTFRRLSLPPIISGIVSGNSKLRANLNTYALPAILQIDSDAIFPMLVFALESTVPKEEEDMVTWHDLEGVVGLPKRLTTNQRVALMIGLLKVARMEFLMDGDVCCSELDGNHIQGPYDHNNVMACVSIKKTFFKIPLVLLEIAVTHSEDSLRIDAAEALCLNPRTASMPSSLELSLLQISVPLNMRCSSTSFRMKWTSLFRRFFVRVRTSIDRQVKAEAVKAKAQKKDLLENIPGDEFTCSMPASLKEMQRFMQWFCQTLIVSIYPSAPYERKSMAMELMGAMIDCWSLTEAANSTFPGTVSFLSADATTVLIGAIVDSWDKLREGAFKILLAYPTPLPGLESVKEVEKVLKWAIGLVNSPRVRESDAGALVLRLIFQKYVVQLGWTLKLHPEPLAISSNFLNKERSHDVGAAVSAYVQSLNDWLEWGIIEGEKNLIKACRHSFVHGALLSYRYTIDELDWKSNALIVGASELQKALDRLLGLLTRVTSIALWVVSADALDMPGGIPRTKPFNVDLHSFLEDESEISMDDLADMTSEQVEDEEVGFLAPSEQAIMVGCWLAMKEVSLLLGTVTRKVPLPGCDTVDMEGQMCSLSMLDLNQLELIGGHFLQVLLSMKHNGAIDKTRAGFIALCNRLLCSEDARLNKMPDLWLQQLMDRTAAKGQTVDDLLRRSAGIPAAFLALFLAEPEGAPKKLLFVAMRWLLDLVKSFLASCEVEFIRTQTKDLPDESTELETATNNEIGKSPLMLKSRDEGVVPTVHAFNTMRVTFNDTNLSTDSSGFCAESLSLAIRAFSCHHWEVRNAAILAFTALLRRMVGFLNTQTYESSRRAITGFEFFHRYPLLHSFLLKELQNATSELNDIFDCIQAPRTSLKRTLHPSLAPVLLILSRLKPSNINSGTGDWLSPSAFMPYVCRCAMQSNMKVRILASRALAPLVESDMLPCVLHELASFLPMQSHSVPQGSMKHSYIFNTLLDHPEDLDDIQASPSRTPSYNTIHGVLLQIHSLLTENCVTLPPNSVLRNEVVSMLSPIIMKIDKRKIFRCPMVGVAFLEVLQSLAKIENSCGSEYVLWDILIQTSAQILDNPNDSVLNQSTWDSTLVSLRNKACSLYFTEALMWWPCSERQEWRVNDDQILDKLRDCIFDCMYEVRLGALKVLKRFFDFLESNYTVNDAASFVMQRIEWTASSVLPLVIECLKTETHPRCLRYALLNYFTFSTFEMKVKGTQPNNVNNLCTRNGNNASVYEMWGLFKHLYHTTKHVKTKEVVICCLGLCTRQIVLLLHEQHASETVDGLNSTQDCSFAKEALQFLLKVIQIHSMANELVMLRRAASKAIIASNILVQIVWVARDHTGVLTSDANEWIIHLVLDVWLVCIKLLEDEDMALRDRLSIEVLHIVSSAVDKKSGSSSFDFVPAQVERVIHLSFDYLTLHMGYSVLYLDCLVNWVWKDISDTCFMQDDCDLVRRLFDKEIDNHHEEKLLFTQLCCLHLSSILNDMDRPRETTLESRNGDSHLSEIPAFIRHWRMKFLTHLRPFVERVVALENRLLWLGGLTNHPDVFRTLYPLLLGVYTFVGLSNMGIESIDLDKQLITELVGVVEIARPFIANPLIFNLLFKMLKLCESQINIELGSDSLQSSQKCLLVENFNPFFLLK